MTRWTPAWSLCALLLMPAVGAGCSQGTLEFTLADEPSTADDASGADTPSDDSDASSQPPVSEDLAELNITINTTSLEVGQRVAVEASARTVSDEVLEDITLAWHVEASDVASFEEPGVLSALAAGQTEVWASNGEVESNRLTISVVAPAEGDSRYAFSTPRQLALAPGQTYGLESEVRRASGEILEGLAVEWRSSDDSVVTVDESGEITAVAAGQAQVSAVVDHGESLPTQVWVSEEPTWHRAQIVRPSSAIAARGEPIEVRVDLREVAVGVADRLGTPVEPAQVEITVDGMSVGDAAIGWHESSFTLDTSGLSEGLHRLAAVVHWNGQTYQAPSRMVWVDAPAADFAESWTNLSSTGDDRFALDDDVGPTNGNAPGLAVDSQGTIYVAVEKPDRGVTGKIYVYRWDEADGRWRVMETYENSNRSQVHLARWSAQYEYFPSNTAQFVDLAVDDQDRLLVTFTQEAVDDGSNGDEREKRWFDVFVARYESGFGPDGSAGWRLLTSGAQDYIIDPPKAVDPQHPPPADVDERDDVFTPQVLWDGQRSRITALWVSAPFPREKTYLDVRTWSDADNQWTTLGERLELPGSVPELREAFFAPDGGLVAVVENRAEDAQERYAVWRMDVDTGSWHRVDTAGRMADAAALGADQLIAANLDRGLLRGVPIEGGVQTSGGEVLNRSPWVSANQPVFVHGTDGNHAPALLWLEGALGSQQWIYGASFADSQWTPLDVDLFTRTLGDGRLVAAADPQGRLVIARQVPRADSENDGPYSLLVVRSLESLIE